MATLALFWAGCGRTGEKPVSVVGSTSVQPFAELLAEEFRNERADITVDVQGGGSAQGLAAAKSGMADIGMCSRVVTDEEARKFSLTPITIARDGLAVVVHPSNPISGLRREQIRALFSGELTNWSAVGGTDERVHLIMREEGSGTREAFVKLVMGKTRVSRRAMVQESNGAVKELVRHDPGAVGYMSLGLVKGELKVLAVDGVAPTVAEVAAGRYTMARPFLFVVRGKLSPAAEAFKDFALSARGQRLLTEEGLVPAR